MNHDVKAGARNRAIIGFAILAILSNCSNGFGYYQAEKGRWMSRDPINDTGFKTLTHHAEPILLKEEMNLFRSFINDPVNRFDPDGRYVIIPAAPVIIIIVGGIAVEFGIRIYCDCAFKKGQEAYIRSPTAVLIHFSGVISGVINTCCNGPGTVRLHLWKDQSGDCHDELIIICLPKPTGEA